MGGRELPDESRHRVPQAGRHAESVDHHQQALALAEELDQPQEVAHAVEGIGHAVHRDDPAAARDHWRRALEIYDRLRVPEAEALRARVMATTDVCDA